MKKTRILPILIYVAIMILLFAWVLGLFDSGSGEIPYSDIVALFQKAVEEHHLENDVVLSGSFCIGKCNRVGVTVQVDDDVHVGVTPESFREFFKKNVLDVIEKERG